MKLNGIFTFLLILSLSISFKTSFGQQIILNENFDNVDVTNNSKIYLSESNNTIQNFKNNFFYSNPVLKINKEKTNWLIFKIKNTSIRNSICYLKSNFLDSLTLYNFESKEVIGVTGNGFSYDALSRKEEVGYIKIELAKNEILSLALKINGKYPKNEVKLELIDGNIIAKQDTTSNNFDYTLLAIILTFIVFNSLIYVILKDNTYLYYLLYLTSLLFYLGSRTLVKGFDLELETYLVDYVITNLFLILFNVFAVKFALSYFENFSNNLWRSALNSYLYFLLIPVVLQLIYFGDYYQEPQNTALAILSLTTIVLILIFTLTHFKYNLRVTSIFLIAETPMILGGIFIACEFLLNQTETTLTYGPNLFKISVVLEILLFSFALGNKYKEQRLLLLKQVALNEQLKIEKLEELKLLSDQKNKELSFIVDQRTNELKKTNEDLIKLNKEKNKIFSILSHDLRSPLASLIMMLELFNSSDLTEKELKEMVKIAKSQLIGLNNSIENLFSWAQSQMEGLTTNPSYFNLEQLINEKINLLSIASNKKNIEISSTINNGTQVYFDRNHLGIVIQNVLNNAIKFTNANGNIKIIAKQNNDHINLTFTDDGVGFNQELITKVNLAQPIQSANGTQGEKGTGLGLILCKELIEKNKGTLSITSIIKMGTTITLDIPASQKQIN